MKYLLLAYTVANGTATISPNEQALCERAYLSNEGALRASGYLLATVQLANPGNLDAGVTTVSVENNELTLGELPSVTTKGQLSKLFFINARDLNEAIRVAAQLPEARMGTVEVRPILAQA